MGNIRSPGDPKGTNAPSTHGDYRGVSNVREMAQKLIGRAEVHTAHLMARPLEIETSKYQNDAKKCITRMRTGLVHTPYSSFLQFTSIRQFPNEKDTPVMEPTLKMSKAAIGIPGRCRSFTLGA